jgi:hypothetical protein
MQKRIMVTAAMGAILLLTSLALGQMLNPQGRPEIKAGDNLAYMIWRDDHGWHLRWTTVKQRRNFSGTLHAVGGTFVNAKAVSMEKKEDRISISPDHIKFNAFTAKGQDGIDFHLGPRTRAVRFELFIDGESRPDRVFIGGAAEHPPGNPFEIHH